MSIFSRGFSEFFNKHQYSDAIIRIRLEPKSRKAATAKSEFFAHRLILSYHSPFFLESFKQVIKQELEKSSQKAEEPEPNATPLSSSTSSGSTGIESPKKRSSASRNRTGIIPSVIFKLEDGKFVIEVECSDERVYSFTRPFFEFIYGAKIDLTEASAFPFFILAQRFKIEPLLAQVSAYIATLLTRESAMRLLKAAIEFDLTFVREKCVDILARQFQAALDDQAVVLDDFLWIPLRDFHAILSHPLLSINEEFTVYKLLKLYIRKSAHSPSLTAEEKLALFSTLRIPFLKFPDLEKVISERLVPEELLAEGVIFRLAGFERPNREVREEELPLRLRRRTLMGRIFTYDHDFDDRGIIYWLSTAMGKSEWKNSSLTGMIKVSSSSIEKGKVHNIIDREPVECWTKDIPSSWFAIDLRQGRLMPTHYTLRHGASSRLDSLRTWVLQASHDGSTWDDISRHQNDSSLNAGFATKTWTLQQNLPPYRHFRLLQTGHNSGNNNFLAVSGFELYGEFFPNPPKTSSAVAPSTSQAGTNAAQTDSLLSISPPSSSSSFMGSLVNLVPSLLSVSNLPRGSTELSSPKS